MLNSGIHFVPAIQNRLKTFVYQTQNVDKSLTKIYMQPFETKGTGEKFALWLRGYIIDPQNYKSNRGEEYAKLDMPIRLIWGKEDTLTPISLGYELQKYIPKAKIYPLEKVGHIPMIEDHAQFDSALLKSIIE
jgi:pimeloyl-ACP methyl ester carboxylesterase